MAHDAGATQRADQISHRVFTKFALVIHNARAIAESTQSGSRDDDWFNLRTPSTDVYKETLRSYRSISSLPALPPPFELRVFLTVSELSNDQVLVYHNPPASRIRVEPTPTHVLLESWQLALTSSPAGSDTDHEDVALATVYKHSLALFRSLYTLLRVLPAWKLRKRLRRRPGPLRSGQLSIEVRAAESSPSALEGDHVLGFEMQLSANSPSLRTQTHIFAPITHPFGLLSVSVRYLAEPHFLLDTMESLLSSRFLSQDEGSEFTPTLARNQQRDSMSGSPGSLPLRTSLPRSPPTSSVADRFVLPSNRMAFPRTSPQAKNVPLPSPLNPSSSAAAASTGSGSGSSTRLSRDESREASNLASHRLSTGRGSDLPSAPRPTPMRRPSINSIHPFKSSTLSSGSPSFHSPSPSLKQHSPLSAGPSLPSRPQVTSSPASTSRVVSGSQVPPVGISGRTMSSPVAPLRPSPPFAPSSLGGRSPIVDSPTGSMPVRPKRYSSSFGHRYAVPGGASSEGSAGSADRERKDSERANASFLSTTTDDDDIAKFVQDIDARPPLRGGTPQIPESSSSRGSDPTSTGGSKLDQDRPTDLVRVRERRDRTLSEGGIRATPATMMMSHVAVEEKLRQLNQAFKDSLDVMDTKAASDNEASRRPSPLSFGGGGSSLPRTTTVRAPESMRRATTISTSSSPGVDVNVVTPTVQSSPTELTGFGQQRRTSEYVPIRRSTRTGSGDSEEIFGRIEVGDSDTNNSNPARGVSRLREPFL